MNNGGSLGQNTFDLFTKLSEGHLGLLNRRQQIYKAATESFLGVVRESFEMKVPEESLKRLQGNMLDLCRLPMETLGDHARLDAYAGELKKLVASMPVAAVNSVASVSMSSTRLMNGRWHELTEYNTRL